MYSSACIRPREEMQARSGHSLRGVEPCIRPREEVQDRSEHGLRGVVRFVRCLCVTRSSSSESVASSLVDLSLLMTRFTRLLLLCRLLSSRK